MRLMEKDCVGDVDGVGEIDDADDVMMEEEEEEEDRWWYDDVEKMVQKM